MITVSTTVVGNLESIWDYFNQPKHIEQWYFASPDWHTPKAENNPQTGGSFNFRMEAKDGSFGFNFSGVYEEVIPYKRLSVNLDDGRKLIITFTSLEDKVTIQEDFEPENQNPEDMQQYGWQAILNNFKQYVEQQ